MKQVLCLCFLLTAIVLPLACTSSKVRAPNFENTSENPDPLNLGFQNQESMSLNALRAKAFSLCQEPYVEFIPEPVPLLDPPAEGGPEAIGLTYQEELEVRTVNLLDRDSFYFSPRPRLAVNKLPMDIFVDDDSTGIYRKKFWTDARPDFSSDKIQPRFTTEDIAASGRYLTELVIGHKDLGDGYPQIFDFRSSAYVRFAGFPPQITGASLRLGAHRIFSFDANKTPGVKENFPVIKAMFFAVKNDKVARAMALLDSEFFCAALDIDMIPGPTSDLIVDGYWYTRSDFNWKKDPHTAFVAYSSMFFKDESHTPENPRDEAHDSDVLTVRFAKGTENRFKLNPPPSGGPIRETDASRMSGNLQPTEWILANEDRNPEHYADFQSPLGSTNYHFRSSYKVSILESSIKTAVTLYEHAPVGEHMDNIVAASTLRGNIKKATNPDQFVRFKYRTTAFFPEP